MNATNSAQTDRASSECDDCKSTIVHLEGLAAGDRSWMANSASSRNFKVSERCVNSSVRGEGGPPELVATMASHMIAPTILLDVFTTARTGLQALSKQIPALCWLYSTLRRPLMLAYEAHYCVMPKVPKTYTATLRTIYLYRLMEQDILLKTSTTLQLPLEQPRSWRQLLQNPCINRLITSITEANKPPQLILCTEAI